MCCSIHCILCIQLYITILFWRCDIVQCSCFVNFNTVTLYSWSEWPGLNELILKYHEAEFSKRMTDLDHKPCIVENFIMMLVKFLTWAITWRVRVERPVTPSPWRRSHGWLNYDLILMLRKMDAWNVICKDSPTRDHKQNLIYRKMLLCW